MNAALVERETRLTCHCQSLTPGDAMPSSKTRDRICPSLWELPVNALDVVEWLLTGPLTANPNSLSSQSHIREEEPIVSQNKSIRKLTMFRTTKKRTRPNRIRLTEEVDNEGEGGVDLSLTENSDLPSDNVDRSHSARLHRTKMNRNVIRSFQDDEIMDSNVTTDKKTKKRRGLGFGGGRSSTTSVVIAKDGVDTTEDQDTASMYNADILNQLKSEQQSYQPAHEPPEQSPELFSPKVHVTQSSSVFDEDFIPLQSTADSANMAFASEEPIVLSGEAAFQLEEPDGAGALGCVDGDDDDNKKHEFNPQLQSLHDQDDEDNADWEVQVARRAGISTRQKQPSYTVPRMGNHADDLEKTTGSPTSTLSMTTIQKQIAASLEQLRAQQSDWEQARQRRQVELEQTSQELSRQQGDLQQSGEALEYYQDLMCRLASWVGAMRALQGKIRPIQELLHAVEADVASLSSWRQWEDDAIAMLSQNDKLDRVLGRQPPLAIYDNVTTVDEFGRDVKSQYALTRESHVRQRRNIRLQREARQERLRGDESDACLSDEEKESLRERQLALREALQVAIDEIDESYSSLQPLVDIFTKWRDSYSEDYTKSYASLCLADLATVLVSVELCSLNDPWDDSNGYNEAKWMTVINKAVKSSLMARSDVERIVEKAVLSSHSDLLAKSGYSLLSTTRTQSLTGFYKHLRKLLPAESGPLTKFREQVSVYVRDCLQAMAIPILHRDASYQQSDDDSDLQEALQFAVVGTMHRLKKILVNLLRYWAPVMSDDNDGFIDCVLDFVSNKFLFLISSLQHLDQPRFAETPPEVFNDVVQLLEQTGWLERPEWMLQAAPIRGAATAFKSQIRQQPCVEKVDGKV